MDLTPEEKVLIEKLKIAITRLRDFICGYKLRDGGDRLPLKSIPEEDRAKFWKRKNKELDCLKVLENEVLLRRPITQIANLYEIANQTLEQELEKDNLKNLNGNETEVFRRKLGEQKECANNLMNYLVNEYPKTKVINY